MVVKATQGQANVSTGWPAHMDAVRAGGLLAGAYHFAHCKQDPKVEAAHFVKTAALLPGEVAALDLERETDGESWPVRVAYALTWLRQVRAATGARPLVYANWSWIKGLRTACTLEQWAELTSYPLWLAEYSGVPGKHSTVTAKDGSSEDSWPIACHQWTNNDGGLDGDLWTGRVLWSDVAVPEGKVA